MKIYINSSHQIVAVRVNDTGDDTLKEIDISDDFFKPYCDTLIKSFCYHEWTDNQGNSLVSIYPYKDSSIMESIQEQNDIREGQYLFTQKTTVDLDLRVTLLELDFPVPSDL